MSHIHEEKFNKEVGLILTDLTCLTMELLSEGDKRADLNEILNRVIIPTQGAFLSRLADFLGQE